MPSYDTVATPEGAAKIVKTAVDAFGRVDILVNNAGILRDKTLLKMDEAMWDAVIAVHLKGTFLCTQAAAKQMVAQGGGGRIVNTTSVSGMLGNFGQANYAAAKAGIYGLTRTAAIELQKHRITVNAIAPIAKTRMTEDLPMFQSAGDTLTPEHVAPAALFLASDLCADKTGNVLAVAGCADVHLQGRPEPREVQGRGRRLDGAGDRGSLGRDHQALSGAGARRRARAPRRPRPERRRARPGLLPADRVARAARGGARARRERLRARRPLLR